MRWRDAGNRREARPVWTEGSYGVEKDRYDKVVFETVRTRAVRLEIQSREGWAGGIHEWRAPGQTARVDCWFDPGPGVKPDDIGGFDLHWKVDRSDGSMGWEQVTPFQQWAPRSYYYYDPWFYGGWGHGPWGYPCRPYYWHRHS